MTEQVNAVSTVCKAACFNYTSAHLVHACGFQELGVSKLAVMQLPCNYSCTTQNNTWTTPQRTLFMRVGFKNSMLANS